MVQRRIKRLTKAQLRFFATLLRERLPLADRFEDTPAPQIIIDCLYYAEAPGLDIENELAELKAPLPCSRQQDSQTAWVMKHIQE
jgi:hypothetical protein